MEYDNLLRKCRDLSQWDRLVALAEEAPQRVAASPEVRQMLALALNRRGARGDQDRAIGLMNQLIAETGGDGETFGILGRFYKERFEQAKSRGDRAVAAENLELALRAYRAGFDMDPKDIYLGLKVATLLLHDPAAQAELEAFVPRVRAAVQEKRDLGPVDYWELTTDLELAVAARDWSAAEEAARQAAALAPSAWMVATTVRELGKIHEALREAIDRSQLQQVMNILHQAEVAAEAAE